MIDPLTAALIVLVPAVAVAVLRRLPVELLDELETEAPVMSRAPVEPLPEPIPVHMHAEDDEPATQGRAE